MLQPPPADPTQSSIGGLIHQVLDDGRAVVAAEVDLYKRIALYRAGKAKNGLLAFVAAALLAFAGLIAFLVGLVIGLAALIGPVGAGIVVLVGTGVVAFLLVRFGAARLGALSGDAEEKAALAAGANEP